MYARRQPDYLLEKAIEEGASKFIRMTGNRCLPQSKIFQPRKRLKCPTGHLLFRGAILAGPRYPVWRDASPLAEQQIQLSRVMLDMAHIV